MIGSSARRSGHAAIVDVEASCGRKGVDGPGLKDATGAVEAGTLVLVEASREGWKLGWLATGQGDGN
jgi:hypothetical protein